ncbi:MAG: hypothetical protein OXI96_09100 [Acidimicrobiaceae bacterium]|nr:hypothetical protein [Acidimicrobiaceae bacterium]
MLENGALVARKGRDLTDRRYGDNQTVGFSPALVNNDLTNILESHIITMGFLSEPQAHRSFPSTRLEQDARPGQPQMEVGQVQAGSGIRGALSSSPSVIYWVTEETAYAFAIVSYHPGVVSGT